MKKLKFNEDMVERIKHGEKIVTRRPIKNVFWLPNSTPKGYLNRNGNLVFGSSCGEILVMENYKCPYGGRGDIHKIDDVTSIQINDISIEKLFDITHQGAEAEGFPYRGWVPSYYDPDSGGDGEEIYPVSEFLEYWDGIYGETKFTAKENPYVWVISIKLL